MTVRATERRLPQIQGLTASSLGQSAASPTNANVILVSYLSSPIATRRLQTYVVFVINDAAFAATVNSYDWTFTNGAATNLNTSIGIAEFTPQNTGSLTVSVNLKNNANAVLANVSLTQQVIPLNSTLELRIDAQERAFPGAAHPDTSREMLNDLRLYINAILPLPANELFNKLICSLAYARTLQSPLPRDSFGIPAFRRNAIIEDYARILNTNPANFYSSAKDGFGVCKTRPQLLAMFLNKQGAAQPYINPIIELNAHASRAQQTANATAIETAFNNQLSTEDKIDLFNLLRFPKSHFAMAQKLFDKLALRYFPSANITQTLGVAANAKKLITEYETGLVAFTASGALTPSPFSNRVFSLMNNPVWAIPVSPLAGGAAGPGVPPPIIPATVGIPEKLPSITFIADATPNDNGFLRYANVYHDNYALNPQAATSFQSIVHELSTATTPIARLRIVSHFALSTNVGGQAFIPFFTNHRDTQNNPIRFTNWWYFKYGNSDEEGLRAYFENEEIVSKTAGFLSNTAIPDSSTNPVSRSPLHIVIFRVLQARHDMSLVPFNLQNTGSPSGSVLTLVKWCADLFAFNNMSFQAAGVNPTVSASPLPASVKATIGTFINSKIDQIKAAAGPLSAGNVDTLRTTVTNLTMNNLPVVLPSLGTVTFTLSGAFLQNYNTLRTELAIVRTRLNNSFVDIRGCRVGQDKTYMRAVRDFFGNPEQQPIVSGPDWFQKFVQYLAAITFEYEADVDAFFGSGYKNKNISVSAVDVQRDYSTWSGRIGINSQLSFWNNLFNGDIFDFLTLTWRSQLPPIGMDSVKLQGLAVLNYPDLITRLKEIFGIPPATGPSDQDLATFNTGSIPRITALQNIQTAVTLLTNASPQAALQAQLTALENIANATGQVLPAAPNPLTKDHLVLCINQLKQVFINQSNLVPLMTEIKTRLSDPKAGIRYMLGIGLGLLIKSTVKEKYEGDLALAYYKSDIDNALKSFMKINWEGPLPTATIAAINALNPTGDPAVNGNNFNDSAKCLSYTGVSIDHADTQFAVNPTEEFHQHIITEPP